MNQTSLPVTSLYQGFLSGMQHVIQKRNFLNDINIFPVPDRDTGNNLSYLMTFIAKKMTPSSDFHTLMTSLSNAAIAGARGNSGSIFSQFFRGFGIIKGVTDTIEIPALISCFQNGYQYAYRSIKQPIEGTILTAMHSFSTAIEQLPHDSDIEEILTFGLKELSQTVENMQVGSKNATQTKEGDAGAFAFLYFIEGFTKGIFSTEVISFQASPLLIVEPDSVNDFHEKLSADIPYRFCTEILIKKLPICPREKLIRIIEKEGDCLVVNDNEELMRIHIHCNRPDRVTKMMADFGEVLEVKADDMQSQYSLSLDHQQETALVIDSIADIPTERQRDFVYQLPINLLVDNVSYQDKRTVYKELLEREGITSSQPNTEQILQFLRPILSRYQNVLILTVSSKMSGLYDRFDEIRAQYPEKITLIDTKLNSVAEGLIVENAIQMIEQKLAPDRIQETLATVIEQTNILVVVPSLLGMIRSGRINTKLGRFLEKVGLRPLVSINPQGKGTIAQIALTKAQLDKTLLHTLSKKKTKIQTYAIAHTYDEEKANELAQALTKIMGMPPLYIEQVSSTVANFSGIGSVAVGYTLKE